jgi:hypothetical protein
MKKETWRKGNSNMEAGGILNNHKHINIEPQGPQNSIISA